MLDKLEAVIRFERPDTWVVVFGQAPDAALRAELAKTAQARPSARKLRDGMVISVPLGEDRWLLWQLSEVPPVSDLAAVMARLQDLSRGLERLLAEGAPVAGLPTPAGLAAPAPTAADGVAGLAARLRTVLNGQAKPKQALVAASLLDILVEHGAIDGGMLVEFTKTGIRRHWLSDSRYRSHAAEMRLVAKALRTSENRSLVVPASGEDAQFLEAALLARQFGSLNAVALLPATDTHGYGLFAFGAKDEALPLLAGALDLATILAPPRTPASERRRWLRRGLVWGILAALVVWLALPAPIAVTATGEATARDLIVVAMPSDGFLKKMHVRPGDRVAIGDVLAEFDSPSLRDMLAEEQLNATIETLSAQAALAENRYSDYQISTERLKIVTTRIAQISDRIAGLRIAATAEGEVIEAMPDSTTGAFARTGDKVAAIQTSDAMRMKLTFARLDARLVLPDMTGTAYFRGTAGRTFDLRVLTPATVIEDPRSGNEVIEAVAEIADPEGVIAGMSGVASLDGPRAPRIVSYGRYAYEFVRRVSWTSLGLKL
jgi:hypothetical protein